jgi:MarR family transcriptional regulator, organic hydroperoxide resistance regulator
VTRHGFSYPRAVDPIFELALCIKATQRELERWMNEAVRPLGITAAQADALAVIAQAEPVSLKELGDLLIAEAGHPSRLVDRLVEADLVHRHADPDDRRRIELSLTPKGRRLAVKVEEARQQALEVGRSLVGDREIGPTLSLFRELLEMSDYHHLIERRRHLMGEHRPSHGAASSRRRSGRR